ncbi:putative ubiquitin hydrolase putativecysteine peptidase Clan CA family C19 [Leptomonas pyrrhocoris]|uniref:Putative ubiquitin hydrolase putativecysteine peptidase Clan CA family C19 n=1 Tax=Leptomonas pyrrhocoris TaxID=157538 RepID=A0A0N0VHV4_LEPPY|nr:putative ubiquitin hydrolase putativecysteine peptidase Clan CA family C19 [Leptomonas pyrrhocoris]KPA86214.1 putative ubiquitin hydrolase putativecysteine peptidase Clan CA family C19 [Leptomonas pyrrhocoris]|eukprot:XP_015664653.1 putative ubiquitin hydrolase putativecysteine peptidase Clan CA family C19 [Leptomonas pyrrhocoris]
MPRTSATNAAEPLSSFIPSRHNRSFSEQTTPSSVVVSMTSSYKGPLRGRRPPVGVTALQKRRFRTQSSTDGQGSRRTSNPAATATAPCRGEAHVFTVHTRPTEDRRVDKGASTGDAAGSKTSSSSCSSSNKAKPKEISSSGEEIVFPKINSVGSLSNVSHSYYSSAAAPKAQNRTDESAAKSNKTGEREAARDFSASAPVTSSSSVFPSQHSIKKMSPTSLNRTAAPTMRGVKDTVDEPPSSSSPAIPYNDRSDATHTAPPSNKRRTSNNSSSSTPNADGLVTPGAVKHKATPPPPQEVSLPSRSEAVASSSAPPTTLLPLPSTVSKPVRNAEGGTEVHSSSVAASSTTAANVDSAAPAIPSRCSQLVCPHVESASSSVALPRVSCQPPVLRTASQQSLSNSQRAKEALLRFSAESTGTDAMRDTSSATLSLQPSTSTRSAPLQPHPPTTLLYTSSDAPSVASNSSQSVQTLQSSTAVTNAAVVSLSHSMSQSSEREHHAHLPSRDASHVKGLSTPGRAHKSHHPVLLPAIMNLYSSPISLRNFGSTCYLNSVVQCLLHTPGLLRALDKDRQRIIKEWEAKKGGRFDEEHRRSCAERNAPATSALLDLGTAKPRQDTPTPQLLLSLKAACGECNEEFAGKGQNDAHELLITLLGVIDKEVCRSKPEAYQTMKDVENECKRDAYARWTERLRQENNSTIYDLFGGVTCSTVQCATCSLVSYRFEALLDISLPMTYNNGPRAAARTTAGDGKHGSVRPEEVVAVDLLLHDMFFSDHGEFLSGPMQVTCDRCKKLRDKTIWSTMEQWPPILVLHLKRFNNAGVKNESAVVFPCTFCPFGRVKYQLYGVCCHRGTASFGHYTSYVFVEGDAATVESPLRKSSSHNCDIAKSHFGDHAGDLDALRGASSGSFARGADDSFGLGEGSDLSFGKSTPQVTTHGSSGSNGSFSSGKGGKWHFCNDESITAVTASEVVSKTKEAYILFYRRVA